MSTLFKLLVLPIIFVVGKAISWIYAGLFGWWLDDLQAQKMDARFAQEIREKLWSLFTAHDAQVVPTTVRATRVMDSACTTVEAGNMRLFFLRGRGDLTVRVAPKHLPEEWHELSLFLMVIDTPQGLGQLTELWHLGQVGTLLQQKWIPLVDALSPDGFEVMLQRLERIYDLSGDDLWRLGIRIPEHLRKADRSRRHHGS